MKIEAFFPSMKAANEAVAKLKVSGITHAYIDVNDHYIENRNVKTNVPGIANSASLSGLILKSDSDLKDNSKRPLSAANPMVSGMGGFEEIAEVQCKVIVEANGSNSEEVKRIIRDMSGFLDNPNVKNPIMKD